MSIVRVALALSAIAATAGCYHWVPTEPSSLPPGTEVRAELTDAGMEEARRYFGPDVEAVEGPLVASDGEGLSLLFTTTLRREGFQPTTLSDTLRLQSRHLADVSRKELHGTKTAWFTAGVIGAAAGAVLAGKALTGSSDDDGEGGGPPTDDAFLIVIPFPLTIGFH